jgi:hypothetical protein
MAVAYQGFELLYSGIQIGITKFEDFRFKKLAQ